MEGIYTRDIHTKGHTHKGTYIWKIYTDGRDIYTRDIHTEVHALSVTHTEVYTLSDTHTEVHTHGGDINIEGLDTQRVIHMEVYIY